MTSSFRRYCLFCLICLVSASSVLAKPHAGVDYVKTTIAGVPLHLVDVDLKRDDLSVRPVLTPAGRTQTFARLISDNRPVAAINGTFFDTLTGVTIGNLVSDGRMLSEGMVGSNLVFYQDGSVALLSCSRNLGRYQDWSKVDFAIGGGPTLLGSGEFIMNPTSEGFTDPSLFKPRPRTAIGVTGKGHLLMVTVTHSITLWDLAKVMKKLDCEHAINLDGGTSTGLSVGGTTMVNPGRKITNILGVFPAHAQPVQQRAIDVSESRAVAHFQRGQDYLATGQIRLARSQFRQAVAKAPGQAGFWRAAGDAEKEFGNNGLAVRDYLTAAQLYYDRGDLLLAESLAQSVLKLDPESLSAHLMSGKCKLEFGQDSEAGVHLQFVLEAQPGHPQAAELMEIIHFHQKTDLNVEACLTTVEKLWQSPLSVSAVEFG